MKQSINIVLSGGGTGGHIYPAVAIANELKAQYPEANILFVGAKDRMEMEKVPQAGYPIKGLWISGLQRKLTFKNLLFPLKLISSLCSAFGIIRKFKPDVVIGTGGFASGPTLYAAALKKNPYFNTRTKFLSGYYQQALGKKSRRDMCCLRWIRAVFSKRKNHQNRKSGTSGFIDYH